MESEKMAAVEASIVIQAPVLANIKAKMEA
jgi:hypothetical protein